MCDAKRWVLVDRDVCSASESFVNFVKKTRWAKTVGTKTKGDGLGSTPILVMLPNSGLLIRFELLCPGKKLTNNCSLTPFNFLWLL